MTPEFRSARSERLEETPVAADPTPVSKLQAVRDYLTQQPDASDAEIVAALAAEGVEVPPDYPASVREQGWDAEAAQVEAVRYELRRNPSVSSEAIAQELRSRGMRVSPELVESVRAALQWS